MNWHLSTYFKTLFISTMHPLYPYTLLYTCPWPPWTCIIPTTFILIHIVVTTLSSLTILEHNKKKIVERVSTFKVYQTHKIITTKELDHFPLKLSSFFDAITNLLTFVFTSTSNHPHSSLHCCFHNFVFILMALCQCKKLLQNQNTQNNKYTQCTFATSM